MTPTNQTNPPSLEGVTQADREAAADLRLAYSKKSEAVCASARAIREGALDGHCFVQAFARHRQASSIPSVGGWRPETYAEFQQRRGRLPDLIENVLADYEGFMKDDAFDAWGQLRKMVAKLETARDFYPTPPLSSEEGIG